MEKLFPDLVQALATVGKRFDAASAGMAEMVWWVKVFCCLLVGLMVLVCWSLCRRN